MLTQWKINSHKLGVLGFSAGGHLAAGTGVHYKDAYTENPNKTNLRPDFMILVNPVISFTDSIGHKGSRDNLLGKEVGIRSNYLFFKRAAHRLPYSLPPSWCMQEDTVVPVENSLFFYEGLRKYKIPAGLHIYSRGEHGFLQVPDFEEWFGRCIYWMEQESFMVSPQSR